MTNCRHSLTVLCCFVLLEVTIAGYVGDVCAPTDNISAGSCKLMTDCNAAVRYIKRMEFHPFSRCGFRGGSEVVCCPLDETVNRVAEIVGDVCAPTGDISAGSCKLLTDCNAAVRHVKEMGFHPFSRCGFRGGSEVVCCPLDEAVYRVADLECKKIKKTNLPPLVPHIIGGTEATHGEFPHMVSLGYNTTGVYNFLCGGSLISECYILTAGHCIESLDRKKPEIARMGVIYIGDGQFNRESDVKIATIMKHPNYTRPFKYNDIALIKLEKPVRFSPKLGPICLYTKDDDPTVPLTVSGWGTTNVTKGLRVPYLQKATVTVVSRKECVLSHPGTRRLPQSIVAGQICAGDPNGLKDSCQGDSGGPLQGLTTDDGFPRLVGVTSYGRGCGSSAPAVYTRVSHYLDWIESIVWPHTH